jgi:hypothetical protein
MDDVKQNNKPSFNAKIGGDLDEKAKKLKEKNTKYTMAYISLLLLGAFFADIGSFVDPTMSISAAVICTFSSFLVYRRKNTRNYTEQWTHTRVIAETIKSEWFMYIVGGGNYPIKEKADEEDCLTSLNSRIKHFMDEYKKKIHSVDGDYVESEKLYIESDSFNYRDKPLEERLDYYKTERMENQKIWYETSSKEMNRKIKNYNSWFKFVVCLGTLIGFLMWINIWQDLNIPLINKADFFSIAIAFAFALDSYSSINQYERLSIVYTKSYHDLVDSIQELNDPNNDISSNEKVFNEFIEDIENKISNEHKSWSLTTSTKNMHIS